MRAIVYYGLINGAVIASAILQHRSVRQLRFGSSRRLSVETLGHSLALRPVRQDLRSLHAEFRSFRDEVIEKLDSIHREMQDHIAACKRSHLTNLERQHKN